MKDIDIKDIKPEHLNEPYKEIAERFGVEVAHWFFEQYKGLQITYASRFLSPDFVKKRVIHESGTHRVREIARRYNYSERWIRQMLRSGNSDD